MQRARAFLGLGIWVAVLPYLGFPYFWKNALLTLSGLVVAYLSYLAYRELKAGDKGKITFDNFSENHGFAEKESSVDEKEESLN